MSDGPLLPDLRQHIQQAVSGYYALGGRSIQIDERLASEIAGRAVAAINAQSTVWDESSLATELPAPLVFTGSRLTWRDASLAFTARQIRVVRMMAGNPGRDFSYLEIFSAARKKTLTEKTAPIEYRANARAVMKRIRQKFIDIDPAFAEIETFATFGYRWRI